MRSNVNIFLYKPLQFAPIPIRRANVDERRTIFVIQYNPLRWTPYGELKTVRLREVSALYFYIENDNMKHENAKHFTEKPHA